MLINLFRAANSVLLVLALAIPAKAAPSTREAPNFSATPANQLVVAGNACGPTALLNAFRFGNSDWQRASNNITGATDKERIYTLIRECGMRPSSHLKGHPRWSRKGVNIADLCDMANETARGQMLPLISQEVFFARKGETQEKLLQRVHQRLDVSLSKGLPPILSLRRYVLRGSEWIVLDAHFVTLISIPQKLEKGTRTFPITYADPWGGKIASGNIAIPERAVLSNSANTAPCLEAVFPQSSVGKKLVRPGEPTMLTLSAVLGRW
ncbi:MAG: hypothetical protein ABI600_08155 [Luteolibacter sp.]